MLPTWLTIDHWQNMKKTQSDFLPSALVFAEEIKVTESEHELPEIWVSAQFIDKLMAFLTEKNVPIIHSEVLIPNTLGMFYDIYRVILRDKLPKKEIVGIFRAFLQTLPTDWIEPYHEDSETPDFEFRLPLFQTRRRHI